MEETLKLILVKLVGMDNKMTGMENKMTTMDTKMSGMESKIKNLNGHVLRIENENGKKLNALFDGYKQSYEKLTEHDKRFDDIESKLEKQDVEIRVIKGGKL